jgi:hypothetical protein
MRESEFALAQGPDRIPTVADKGGLSSPRTLRSLKARAPFRGDNATSDDELELELEPGTMGFCVVEMVFCFLGVRGHIPHFDDYRPLPAAPSSPASAGALVRTLTVLVVTVAFVAFAVWAAVWLAIRLL